MFRNVGGAGSNIIPSSTNNGEKIRRHEGVVAQDVAKGQGNKVATQARAQSKGHLP